MKRQRRHHQPARPLRHRRSAFTLVEVMISVALVLFLILGVNQVFKMTSDTVGAGQVMSANIRDTRAAQAVLFNDLTNAVMQQPPAFWISSSRTSAFRNRADRESAIEFAKNSTEADVRKIDLNNNGTEGDLPGVMAGEIISPATYNFRSHRTDRMGFFSRGAYKRQTGNDGTFASPTSSSEAYIWYGHLKLHDNSQAYDPDANFRIPGGLPAETVATNPNNLDAASFALGRMVMVMRDPIIAPLTEAHFARSPAWPPSGVPAANTFLTPFGYGSTGGGFRIQESRYDLAGISIAQFLYDTTQASTGAAPNADWWQRLVYSPASVAYGPLTAPRPATDDYRFVGDRFFARPLDAQKASRMAPILLNGCAQFIVEYAGDYLTQNQTDPTAATYGDVTGNVPDGVTDFAVETIGTERVRRTRWYGMPRDVAGNTVTGGPDGVVAAGTAADPTPDVVPLRDLRGTPSSFERYVDQQLPTKADYLSTPTATTPAMLPEARYDCVWGPDTNLNVNDPLPQMLRITIVLDEPTGRLAEGQIYEYVITLPR